MGGGVRRKCAAGTYSEKGSSSEKCDGLCDAGYWCTVASPNKQQNICDAGRFGQAGMTTPSCTGSCLKGYYCPAGSTTQWQNECGDEYHYCPHGSGAPTAVSPGFYSTGGNSTTRYAEEPCG